MKKTLIDEAVFKKGQRPLSEAGYGCPPAKHDVDMIQSVAAESVRHTCLVTRTSIELTTILITIETANRGIILLRKHSKAAEKLLISIWRQNGFLA